MADGAYLLVKFAEEIQWNLCLPMACDFCCKIAEEEQTHSQSRQKKGVDLCFGGCAKGQAIFGRTDR